MTRCQDDYAALRGRTPELVAELLVRNGERFDRDLREDYAMDALFGRGEPWFVPAALLALRWSKHADTSDDGWDHYFEVGCRFMHGAEVLDDLRQHAGRFGPASFVRALEGYRALFLAKQRDLFDNIPSTPAELRANQEDLIKVFGTPVLHGLPGSTVGIGPWLGLAPHKILLIWNRSWWANPECDGVYQPLGSVVTRALRRLARDGAVDRDEVRMLPREEEDRTDGFGTVAIAQGIQQRLADLAGGRVMHVNSGLYELGYWAPGS